MFSLGQLIKNYDEIGLLNEQVSPQGFIDEHLFVTKAGDLGAVNDPVTSLILGGAYCSNGKEDQRQTRLRVSWDTSAATSVFNKHAP